MAGMHGFTLIQDKDIPEIGGKACLYAHDRTGARLMSVINDDENKVFGITFRTPPADSTGVAHILEHSVLCGSKKYPVKEPFVELLKGSLQTFLNAFTYPDKTCYPVASQNLQDFYNLIDVYLDAVFHPRITEDIFRQEGWHYELETPDGPLTRKGVVYNEMKGAYSSPDGLLHEYSQRSVFPDITYGLDSGGDPDVIPELTHEMFRSFHERCYHPSNAWIWFSGNDDPVERLRITDAFLSEYGHGEPDTAVGLQKKPGPAVPVVVPFDSGDGQTRGMFTCNWLLPETVDIEAVFALTILEEALLGSASSPLRRVLIESGLGEDIAGIGLEDELRQMYFSVGLKGVDPSDFDRAAALVRDTLSGLAENGIPDDITEAACNTVLFRLRENNTGRFPRGLSLMLRALRTWLYGGDPFSLLAFEGPLGKVLETIRGDRKYLSGLIRKYLTGDDGYREVRLVPDETLGKRREAKEREDLERILVKMDSAARDGLIRETAALLDLQQTPDPPEALSTIPRLTVADLERDPKIIPSAYTEKGLSGFLTHPQDTSGITYVDIAFPLDHLEEDLLPWIPVFGRALSGMGTEDRTYDALATRIGAATGGIRRSSWAAPAESGSAAQRLLVRGRALTEQEDDQNALLEEVLRRTVFDDRERFLQLVLEAKARLEQNLIPSGHQIVLRRLQAGLGTAHHVDEMFHGVSQLFFLRELENRVREDWPAVLETLRALHRRIIRSAGAVAGITAGDGALPAARARMEALLGVFPAEREDSAARSVLRSAAPELLTIPARVNYAGIAADLYESGYVFHGSALVVSRFLRTSWLWEQVRVQGGAYGAFSPFSRQSGVMAFVSYRDPNCVKTLETFRASAGFLTGTAFSRDDIEKAVLGTIGDLDTHLLPEAKGMTSLKRHLTGTNDELRARIREEVLSTTASHFREFGTVLEAALRKGSIAVLGEEGKKAELPENTTVTPVQ